MDISGTGKSLVRMAYDRCTGVVPAENIIVITLAKFKDIIKEQIPELPEENLLLEPYARRTAPCVAYSTYHLLKRNPHAVAAVTPADLVINDEKLFKETLTNALDYAEKNPVLMTLGIKPSRPDTEQTIVQEYFNMMMIVDMTKMQKPFVEAADELAKLGEGIGVQVKCQREEIFDVMHRI